MLWYELAHSQPHSQDMRIKVAHSQPHSQDMRIKVAHSQPHSQDMRIKSDSNFYLIEACVIRSRTLKDENGQ